MIRIDLLPHTAEEEAASVLFDIPWKSIGMGLLAFCISASLGLTLVRQLQGHALHRLKRDWNGLQPKLRQLEATETAIRALQNRAKVHQMLKAPEAQWAPRLNLLSDSLVSQLWFTALRFEAPKKSGKAPQRPAEKPKSEPPTPAAPALILEGSALVGAAGVGAPVSRYLQRLKGQPVFSQWFREVELKSVQQRQVQQEQVSDFVMAFYPTGQ